MATMALGIISESEAAGRRILIADDQPDVLEALRLLLKGHGYSIETVTSPAAMLEALSLREFDLILMDLNYARDTTSGREGLDLLDHLKKLDGAPPIVVMTGWATVGLAVETIQHGVGDFVEKPWVNSRLLEILQKQLDLGRERREARRRALEESRTRTEMARHFQEQEREMGEARAIQEGFLPKSNPHLAGYEISGAWQPARIVGGDYFDFLSFGEESLGICIADVEGKGMPAAMLMSNLQAAVRGLASPSLSPDLLGERLNSQVCTNIASARLITFFYAQLDGPARHLRYVNAGHNAPVVCHQDGSHERLTAGGGVLGVFPRQSYSMGEIELLAGDHILLFTDGVTEAPNGDGEEFGEPRLLELLRENRSASATDLQKLILEAVGDFCRHNFHDDATLIAIAVE
jgi:phosphoserine phosphatase RsbU/P